MFCKQKLVEVTYSDYSSDKNVFEIRIDVDFLKDGSSLSATMLSCSSSSLVFKMGHYARSS